MYNPNHSFMAQFFLRQKSRVWSELKLACLELCLAIIKSDLHMIMIKTTGIVPKQCKVVIFVYLNVSKSPNANIITGITEENIANNQTVDTDMNRITRSFFSSSIGFFTAFSLKNTNRVTCRILAVSSICIGRIITFERRLRKSIKRNIIQWFL